MIKNILLIINVLNFFLVRAQEVGDTVLIQITNELCVTKNHLTKIYKIDNEYDRVFFVKNYCFLSSLNKKVITVAYNGITTNVIDIDGISPLTKIIYNPEFYSDNKYIYWGKINDFQYMKFKLLNKRWNAEKVDILISDEYFPDSILFDKILYFNRYKILFKNERGNAISNKNKKIHSAVYSLDSNNNCNLFYEILLDTPTVNHSYEPDFPSLSGVIIGNDLFILDTYNKKISVFNNDLKVIKTYNIDYNVLNLEPTSCQLCYPPVYRLKIVGGGDNEIFLKAKNENKNEVLWKLEFDKQFTNYSIIRIPLTLKKEYSIQQVDENKIVILISFNLQKFLCVRRIEQ